ncbi:MAG: hypothetical protein ACFFDN_37315 [Candidatus Hodarchaeota archaeon]
MYEDNNISVQTKATKTGTLGALMRNYYRNKGPNEREVTLTETLSKDYPNVKLDKFQIQFIQKYPFCRHSRS